MREYIVSLGGVDLTVQLSDEDAKRLKARPVTEEKAKVPANKSRAPRNK